VRIAWVSTGGAAPWSQSRPATRNRLHLGVRFRPAHVMVRDRAGLFDVRWICFFSPPPPSGRSLTRRADRPFHRLGDRGLGTGRQVSRAIDWDFLLLESGVPWDALVRDGSAAAVGVLRLTPAIRMSDRGLAVAGNRRPLASPSWRRASRASCRRGNPAIPTFRVPGCLTGLAIYNHQRSASRDGILRPAAVRSERTDGVHAVRIRANTALARRTCPRPVLDFVEPLAATPHPPNLFRFVVDSLRPGPIWRPTNPAVHVHAANRRIRLGRPSSFENRVHSAMGATGLSLTGCPGWAPLARNSSSTCKPFLGAPNNEYSREAAQPPIATGGVIGGGWNVIMEAVCCGRARRADVSKNSIAAVRTMDYRLMPQRSMKLEAEDCPCRPRPMAGSHLRLLVAARICMCSEHHVGVCSGGRVASSYPGFHAPYASRPYARSIACFV
jgi:hypothetical protein